MNLSPTLRYTDAHAALEFLTGTLGLVTGAVHTGERGEIGHAELSWGDGVVMIGTRRAGEDAFDTGRAVIYLTTDEPDALHARIAAAGAEVVQGLTDQPYGSREFAVADPEGNVWCFGTYVPTPAGQAAAAR